MNTRPKTATAGYETPAYSAENACSVHVFASSTTTEMVAIRMALERFRTLDHPSLAVFLTDSRSVRLQLSNPDQAELLTREVGQLCRAVEDKGWALAVYIITSLAKNTQMVWLHLPMLLLFIWNALVLRELSSAKMCSTTTHILELLVARCQIL